MYKKICSFTNKTIYISEHLERILAKHSEALSRLSETRNKKEVRYIFLEYFNAQISDVPKNSKTLLLLFLYHSLKSVLNCSDIVIYQAEMDQIFGEANDEYLWLKTLFADPHHSSRFDVKTISSEDSPSWQVEILDVYSIEGTEEFEFEKIITPIKLENGVLFAEATAVKDRNGNILSTKNIELSGNSGSIAVRLPKNSEKAQRFMELNNPDSEYAIRKGDDGKPLAIFYQETPENLSSSKRMLHSVYIKTLIELLKARKQEALLPEILGFLFHEGIMINVHKEQEFNGNAGLRVIAMAHNVNHYIEIIIEALRRGKKLSIIGNSVLINGKPIELLNSDPDLLKSKIDVALTIIKNIQDIIKKQDFEKIKEQAESFQQNKQRITEKEKEKLSSSELQDTHVTYFAPIKINDVLSLIKESKTAQFLEYIATHDMLLTTTEGQFLNFKNLGKRSQLVNEFFSGKVPADIQKLLQPSLKGKVLCQPHIASDGITIQTKVIIIFDKPIHKTPEDLFNPLFILDELSSEKTFVDPRFEGFADYGPERVPFFHKSKDGTTLEWIIDYDIWSYPDRKILFRFCEGIHNTIEYDDNEKINKATDIPNILLSKNRVTTARINENSIMKFFENITKTRRYKVESENDESILTNCIKNRNFRRTVLTYFIRNHITDSNAIKIEPMFERLLFRYLILDIDDAKFALSQIKGYHNIEKLNNKHNPFFRSIKLYIQNNS